MACGPSRARPRTTPPTTQAGVHQVGASKLCFAETNLVKKFRCEFVGRVKVVSKKGHRLAVGGAGLRGRVVRAGMDDTEDADTVPLLVAHGGASDGDLEDPPVLARGSVNQDNVRTSLGEDPPPMGGDEHEKGAFSCKDDVLYADSCFDTKV